MQWWWIPLVVYIVPNLLLYILTIAYGVIIVDMIPIFSEISISTASLCLLSVLITFLIVFRTCVIGQKQFADAPEKPLTNTVGVIIFLLQLLGLFTLFWFDYGRVKGMGNSSSIVVKIVSYLNIDAIFLMYYGHSRSKKVPWYNLSLYLISMTLRGWSGAWFIIFFIESYYVLKKKSLKEISLKLLFIAIIALAAFPTVNRYKEIFRGNTSSENISYVFSVTKLMVRLQHVTSIMLIAQESDNIQSSIKNQEVRPYYSDNKIGDRLLGLDHRNISLQKFLTISYLVDFNKVDNNASISDIGWYIHTGIAGWFFVIHWQAFPLYLLFVFLLLFVPYWLASRFLGESSIIPVLHTVALMYVFHGWFSVQISFITGILWYIAIVNIFNRNISLNFVQLFKISSN